MFLYFYSFIFAFYDTYLNCLFSTQMKKKRNMILLNINKNYTNLQFSNIHQYELKYTLILLQCIQRSFSLRSNWPVMYSVHALLLMYLLFKELEIIQHTWQGGRVVKASDSGSDVHMHAWVRIPPLPRFVYFV